MWSNGVLNRYFIVYRMINFAPNIHQDFDGDFNLRPVLVSAVTPKP